MTRGKSRSQLEAAARAREGLARKRLGLQETNSSPARSSESDDEVSDDEECNWDGNVNCWSDAESDVADWVDDEDLLSDTELPDEIIEAIVYDVVEEMVGEELSQSLENEVERAKTVFDEIMQLREPGYWKQAEAGVQRGARDGKSGRQRRRDDKEGRDKDLEDAEIQDTEGARKFADMFVVKPVEDPNTTPQSRAEDAAKAARKETDAKFKSATRKARKTAGGGQKTLASMFTRTPHSSKTPAVSQSDSNSDLASGIKLPAGISPDVYAAALAKAKASTAALVQKADAAFAARESGGLMHPSRTDPFGGQPSRSPTAHPNPVSLGGLAGMDRTTDTGTSSQPVQEGSSARAKPSRGAAKRTVQGKGVCGTERNGDTRTRPHDTSVKDGDVNNSESPSRARAENAVDSIFDGYLSDDEIEDLFPMADEADSDAEDWLDDDLAPGAPSVTVTSPPVDFIDPVLLAEDAAASFARDTPAAAPQTSNIRAEDLEGSTPQRDRRRSVSPSGSEPARKRRRLEIPVRQARARKQAEVALQRRRALHDLQKLMISRKTQFESGEHGLQARRARAIESCLHMMVQDKEKMMVASRIAARAHRFAEEWGSRLVRSWTQKWVKERSLPDSDRGQHAKIQSIFDDPVIRAEIRSYLRSHKWSVNPPKLQKFLDNELERGEATSYAKELLSKEMPRGLKAYVEETVLPRLHLKASHLGLSLATMRRVMIREGFAFMEHKKAIYFDGHERPDVVADRVHRFIPAMLAIRPKIAKYVVGDVDKEAERDPQYAHLPLHVLVAHDEMTVQCHDGRKSSWGPKGEQPLLKKGAGQGIHVSGFVCSTVGWLDEAGATLEYGKNHEGWWTGEHFIKQLKEKFFPVFEAAHEPGTVAVVLVDNSQGHCAYAEDALRVSRMNMRPGGKQARMRDGWFMRGDERVVQQMVFADDYADVDRAGQAKGMQRVLEERGLFRRGMLMQCKEGCADEATNCCATRIISLQPDFVEQKSLVQETIEAAGHICIMLPKYHCEINFIEYFWGTVKRYLREHCDYTFKTLRDNLPKALRSVSTQLIRKWEHRAWRFIEAYAGGMGAKDAQFQVKKFSSRKYTSHRRVPEGLASSLDA